ncbi:MAG: hypothetical protein K2H14_08665 [Muribaculaceae bacterium]|nr:hypothetical protein [Muribaculaceae bacterium]
MPIKKTAGKLALLSTLLLSCAAESMAQSAIYACGHIRRERTQAISNLRASGYTTAILFNVNVENDGTLTTDFSWDSQTPAQAGGIICQNGEYVFGKYQPNYISDIRLLLTAPTSINRIEICIGGWGNGSYGNIRNLIERDGTGEETMLYRNFKALKEALPEIMAVNNDQEQDYDLASATAFHRMMAEIGYKTTVAPYMHRDYWKDLVAALNTTPGTCDLVYLQTYGGGAGNNPSDWKVFGDVPMYIGFDCEASADLAAMQTRFKNWRDNDGVAGGFLWNYNSEARDHNEWATAINRIFEVKTCPDPVVTVYQDADYGGYAIGLPAGSFTQGELALYGLKARDVSSIKISEGYKATIYIGANLRGSKTTFTESTPYVGDQWNDRTRSIIIEKTEEDGIADIIADNGRATLSVSSDADTFSVDGAGADTIEIFSNAGTKIASAAPDSSGRASIDMSSCPDGIYLVVAGRRSVKAVKR